MHGAAPDGLRVLKHNFLYPKEEARVPYVTTKLADAEGPILASSDYMSDVPDQIRQFLPNPVRDTGRRRTRLLRHTASGSPLLPHRHALDGGTSPADVG
jgi:hypothetical protein